MGVAWIHFSPLKVPEAVEKQIVYALFGVKPSTIELVITRIVIVNNPSALWYGLIM